MADGPSSLDCRFVESLGSVLQSFDWKDVAGKWCQLKHISAKGEVAGAWMISPHCIWKKRLSINNIKDFERYVIIALVLTIYYTLI